MPGSQSDEKGHSHGGFSSFMDDLKDKLHDTKIHDAKIKLHHKKYVRFFLAVNECFSKFRSPVAETKLAS